MIIIMLLDQPNSMQRPAITLLEMTVVLIIVASMGFFSFWGQPKNTQNEQAKFWQTLDLEIRQTQSRVKFSDERITFYFKRKSLEITDNKTHQKIINYPKDIQVTNINPARIVFKKYDSQMENVAFGVIENGSAKEYRLIFGLEWGAFKFEPIPTSLYRN